MQLPKGFTVEVPQDTTLSSAFADYSAHYSVKNGSLFAERKMVIKQAKVVVEQWAAYQKFSKGIRTDQTRFLSLSEIGGGQTAAVSEDNRTAEQLMERVSTAMQAPNVNEARDLLAQVERLNPKQAKLWAIYGYLAMTSGKLEEAIADCRKEIQFHPDEIPAYRELTSILLEAGRREEAIEAWRAALAVKPEDEIAATQIVTLMMQAKRYTEIPAVLEKPIAAAPEQYQLRCLRIGALLRSGQKDQGVAEAQKIAEATSEPKVLNDLAYYLSDTGAAVRIAQEWAQKALSQTEQDSAKAGLASFENRNLIEVNLLAAEWDERCLGRTEFRPNDYRRSRVKRAYAIAKYFGDPAAHVRYAEMIGLGIEQLGRPKQALQFLDEAITTQEQHPEVARPSVGQK